MQISEILNYLRNCNYQYIFSGDEHAEIEGFCRLIDLKDHAVTWARHSDNITEAVAEQLKVRKGMLLVVGDESLVKGDHNYIVTTDPKAVFFKVLGHFFEKERKIFLSEHSVIETEDIGENVTVGHYCYINPQVVIGDGVEIHNNVSIISPCKIGAHSVIHSGVVIGTDGFGYYDDHGTNKRVPHFGGVVLGESVELGANTCIDRGTMSDTVICDNVKIDNLCHIGHNVYIGENSLVTACSVLGGSCRLEKNSYVGIGGVIRNQIEIGENGFIAMGAVVTKPVEKNKVVAGVPAKVLREN